MTPRRVFSIGLLIMAAAALVGLVVAAIGYLTPTSGIAGTAGALLVVLSSAALLIAAMLMPMLREHVRWLYLVVVVLCALAVLGTAVAAYFLELPLVIVAVVVAALGLIWHLMAPTSDKEYAR